MNRDFSFEYKKYADSDTPDLWSRIEAGVDEYEKTVAKAADSSPAVNDKNDNKIINIASSPKYSANNKTNTKETKKESRFAVFARRYGGMVAAVACGVAVLSVVGITRLASKGDYSSAAPSAMSESAAPAAMESAEEADEAVSYAAEASNDAAAEEYDGAAMEAAEAETYVAEAEESYDSASEAEESYDMAAEAPAGEEAAADTHTDGMTNGSYSAPALKAEKNYDMAAETAQETADLSELKASEKAKTSRGIQMMLKARITSVSDSSDTKKKDDDELTCELTVSEPDGSVFEKGDQITVQIDPSAKEAIALIRDKGIDKTKQYNVTLIFKDGKYLVTEIE